MTGNAAIYLRISRDPEGQRLGVDRQREDCLRLVEREGLQLGRIYEDNDIGASTLSRKRRPQYDEMIAAVERGEHDVIVAYSNSRLTRRLRELIDLIELHNRTKVQFKTVASGDFNLSTADGRMVAQLMGTIDQAEAERAGERVERAHLQRALRGTTNNGGRPFGWQEDRLTLHPVESALIRKAVDDVIDGVGLNAIAREWNHAGVTTARGHTWDHRSVRQSLRRHRLAGIRIHKGKVLFDGNGEPVSGEWEPLIDAVTFARLQVSLSARAGASAGRRGARKYLLSGIVRCGVCNSAMYGSAVPRALDPDAFAYVCSVNNDENAHTNSIAGGQADEAITAVVISALKRAGKLTSGWNSAHAVEFDDAGRISEINDKIDELMLAYTKGTVSAALTLSAVGSLERERNELIAERDRSEMRTATPPIEVDPAAFLELDTDRQRAVIEKLVDAIVVSKSRKGAPWSADRMAVIWKSD